MTRTKVVTSAMPNNIYRILKFVRVSVMMFLANFGLEQYEWLLRTPAGEGKFEEELAPH